MLAYFFHVTLSANQNAYSYIIRGVGGGGGICVLYNKIGDLNADTVVSDVHFTAEANKSFFIAFMDSYKYFMLWCSCFNTH